MRAERCLFALGFATAAVATITSGQTDVPSLTGEAELTVHGFRSSVAGLPSHPASSDNEEREIEDPLSQARVLLELPLPGMGGGLGQDGSGRGWLARWMALGGEGEVVVHTSTGNLTFPHRPAAFPQHLPQAFRLPTAGLLIPFTSFPPPPSSKAIMKVPTTPAQACVPATWPPIRWSPPPFITGPNRTQGVKIALLERGGCDFATKVLAAQERGAGAVIVGDTAEDGEGREEARRRVGGLITMFSPEDTENIHIPSVFISRSAYLDLLDMFNSTAASLATGTGEGLWIEIGDGADENATLGGMLSFALLMPSCFLLATIAIHRMRVTRQKEQDRAPPQVVLSLPERVWQPDIVWEKDDSPLSSPADGVDPSLTPNTKTSISFSDTSQNSSRRPSPQRSPSKSGPSSATLGLPPISARDLITPPAIESPNPFDSPTTHTPVASGSSRPIQARKKSNATITNKRRYFSKDECAICMDEFRAGDIVRILPCGHVFHKEECDEWLLKWRKLCPTCRADVTLPPGSATPQVGVRLTPVDGVQVPGGIEHDDSWAGQAREVGRSVSRWIEQTRGRLFGRQRADGGELDERTPLVRQGEGTV